MKQSPLVSQGITTVGYVEQPSENVEQPIKNGETSELTQNKKRYKKIIKILKAMYLDVIHESW